MTSDKTRHPQPPHAALPPTHPSRRVSRGEATRHLLAPSRIRESFAVGSPPSLRTAVVAGMQAALAVFIAVAATHLSPWAHLQGFAALGALAALFGRFAPVTQRMGIVAISGLLLASSVGLVSVLSYLGLSEAALLLCLGILAGVLFMLVVRWRISGPGAVIFIFAASAALGPADTWHAIVERTIFTVAGAIVASILCAATDWLRTPLPTPIAGQQEPLPPVRALLIAASRIAIGAAAAALLAHYAGWSHPAWAAIGAIAVLQGTHLHLTMHRAVQRMIGTMLGAVIAWLILINHPSFWVLLFAVVVLQLITEIVIGFNYAFGQITVTPMALLMTSLASPAAASAMPVARVFDTVLGALLGIVFAIAFSSLDDRAHLAAHHAQGSKQRG